MTSASPFIRLQEGAARRTALLGGKLRFYSGNKPDAAWKAVPGGAILVAEATGISFDPPVVALTPTTGTRAVRLSKPAAANWQYNILAAGTIGWARYVGSAADAGLDDPTGTLARLDWTCGLDGSGAEIILGKLTFQAGDVGTAFGQVSVLDHWLVDGLQPVSPL